MSHTRQPQWKLAHNLGDAHPLTYGGYFVFTDQTGVYPPEVEVLEEPTDDVELDSPDARWTVYRFILEPCTWRDGILSDNSYHPDYPVWFAQPDNEARPQDTCYLSRLAQSVEMTVEALARAFCSADLVERADAWRNVGQYHGWHELDPDPLTLTRAEVEARYPGFK